MVGWKFCVGDCQGLYVHALVYYGDHIAKVACHASPWHCGFCFPKIIGTWSSLSFFLGETH